MIRRSLIAAAVLAATSTFAPLAAQAQTVLKAADVHPAGYPNVVAIVDSTVAADSCGPGCSKHC